MCGLILSLTNYYHDYHPIFSRKSNHRIFDGKSSEIFIIFVGAVNLLIEITVPIFLVYAIGETLLAGLKATALIIAVFLSPAAALRNVR